MSQRDDTAALKHMLEYAQTAKRIAQGHAREDMDRDETLRLALTRAVEVIGEAAARVPDHIRQQSADIPWGQIVATRNRLIHGYDTVDLDLLWSIVSNDLSSLIVGLRTLLGQIG
jgi:uncharacterized protein with HEPN domain